MNLRTWSLGVVIGLVLIVVSRAAWGASAPDEFDQRIRAELEAMEPGAVAALDAANAARDEERFADAERGYREVLDRAPEFVHAKRRLCGVVSALGRHDEAIDLCREALAEVDSPENRFALMHALLGDGEPNANDLAEAGNLARDFMAEVDDADPLLWIGVCQVAAVANRLDTLQRCKAKLERVSPSAPELHYFGWILAASEGDLSRAEAELDAAEEAGLDPQMLAALRELTDDARPWWWKAGIWAAWVLAAWFVTFAVLIVTGVLLSHATLASAERLPSVRSGDAVGTTAALRKVYAFVLMLACAFYYLSIPIMLATVVLAGAGILLAIFYFGHIPIKLVAIIGIGVLVTVAAVVRSIVVRTEDHDPGERLDLAMHPELRELLQEVADKVGTRPVDNVYLTPHTDLGVFERGGLFRQLTGKSERCLVIGVAVLDGMQVGQLRAILAHEYGHFSNRDTAGGGFALAVRHSMMSMAMRLAEGGAAGWYNPAWLFVVGFHKLFLRISQGASRLQEILADRWAVFSYGAAAFEGGLRHVIDRSVRFDADTNAYLSRIVEARAPMRNLYRESAGESGQPPKEGEAVNVEELVREAIEAEPSPFDSHPRPLDRFRWAHLLESDADPGPGAELEAWTVVGSRDDLELRMTELVRRNIAEGMGVAIPAEAEAASEADARPAG